MHEGLLETKDWVERYENQLHSHLSTGIQSNKYEIPVDEPLALITPASDEQRLPFPSVLFFCK